MSDANTAANGNLTNSLMDLDLTSVQTVFPLIDPGLKTVRVAEISITPNRSGTGDNLKMKLVTTEAYRGSRGSEPVELQPGYAIMFTTSLVKTEKFNPLERLASIMDCFLGRRGSFMPIEQFLGAEGVIKVAHKGAAGDEYGIQAEVKQFCKKG